MQVRAKERGFHGCLRNPGDEFAMPLKEGEKLPGWVEALDEEESESAQGQYHAARSAAGKFVVKDATGHPVDGFSGTKAEAEAEAARLNAESAQG
ncbi:hypothetical protein D3C81_1237970 [compost metagenome]